MRNFVSKSYEWKHAKINESVKESYTTSISVMHTVFQSNWDPYDPNSAMTSILSKVMTNTVQEEVLLMSQVCAFQQNS